MYGVYICIDITIRMNTTYLYTYIRIYFYRVTYSLKSSCSHSNLLLYSTKRSRNFTENSQVALTLRVAVNRKVLRAGRTLLSELLIATYDNYHYDPP